MSLIQESLRTVLPARRKKTAGGWESFNAPCCHNRGESRDSRKRGGVIFNNEGFTYHCFNCGFKAGWQLGKSLSKNTKDLLAWLGLPSAEIDRLVLEALRERDAVAPAKKQISFELEDMALPDDCLSIKDWAAEGCTDQDLIAVIDYILSRNLTLDDYNWHWSAANGYRDRVILPFYHEGRIVGWTGRKIKEGKPKYLAMSQNGYVFNLDAQAYERKFVIVVEGQFDAVAVGGVAIMHNEPNEVQCARINRLAKEVILVPDRDRPGAKMVNAALANSWSVSLPPWASDVKDVADAVKKYGKIYTLSSILHYRESNKIKIELLKKKLENLNDQ